MPEHTLLSADYMGMEPPCRLTAREAPQKLHAFYWRHEMNARTRDGLTTFARSFLVRFVVTGATANIGCICSKPEPSQHHDMSSDSALPVQRRP